MHAARSVDIQFAALLPSLMLRWVIDEVALVVSCDVVAERGINGVADPHVVWREAVAHADVIIDRTLIYLGVLILRFCLCFESLLHVPTIVQ